MRPLTQALTALAVVGVVAGGSTAFTASNVNGTGGNFVASSLGQGSTVTSGYAVSGVTYTLGSTSGDADRVKAVAFTLTGAVLPTVVKIRLATADTYGAGMTGCTFTTSPGSSAVPVSCTATAPGYPISGINTLDILADSF